LTVLDAAHQRVRIHAERTLQANERRKTHFTLATLDAAHLDRREPCPFRKVLLRPPARQSCLAYVRPEALDGIHITMLG
jgi:hypothetical protein